VCYPQDHGHGHGHGHGSPLKAKPKAPAEPSKPVIRPPAPTAAAVPAHVHGPGCGHMAIKFDANDTEDGATKIAFADLESGDMDVRTATHRTAPYRTPAARCVPTG
jgi:hypothetical protein